jgi:Glycosyl hydrolases family 43
MRFLQRTWLPGRSTRGCWIRLPSNGPTGLCGHRPSSAKTSAIFYSFRPTIFKAGIATLGGIGIAVADHPAGPFRDYLGKPLINQFYNNAQPIDQFVFKDRDEQYYIIYGGWGRCNVGKLNKDFTGLVPFSDSMPVKEITPKGYVEGATLFIRNNKYYLMWSEGGWTNGTYKVAYGVSDNVFGPFERKATVLQADTAIATGAGHHSVINIPNTDEWYIVYHRRPIPNLDRDHRVVCIDRMLFDADGNIKKVKMTFEGVRREVK